MTGIRTRELLQLEIMPLLKLHPLPYQKLQRVMPPTMVQLLKKTPSLKTRRTMRRRQKKSKNLQENKRKKTTKKRNMTVTTN